MLAKVLSGTTIGLDGVLITVEVDVAERGFPGFTIVGLPDKSVDEARERVRSAIVNTSFEMPDTRLTVNLAPADIQKVGSAFDLPIAVGILTAAGMVKKESLDDCLFVGELSLEGTVRKVPGVLSISLMAKSKKISRVFVPAENATEAVLVDEVEVYPVRSFGELILHLNGEVCLAPQSKQNFVFGSRHENNYLFENIKGQLAAKRACEIAAAGFHNVLFKGPPGTGKTLFSFAC